MDILNRDSLYRYFTLRLQIFLDIIGNEVYESLEPTNFTNLDKMETENQAPNLQTSQELKNMNIELDNDEEINLFGAVYPDKKVEQQINSFPYL